MFAGRKFSTTFDSTKGTQAMNTVKVSFDEALNKNVTVLDGQLINIHNSKEVAEEAASRYTIQFNCKHCNGTGRIYWGDSEYQCAHNS